MHDQANTPKENPSAHGRRFPVAEPALVGREREYVLDCIDSTWISSKGKYIERFENDFATFCGVRHAVSCTNGTVALHLALLALGIGAGDEVIIPTLTYVATANAVRYCNATPIFVDSEPTTWNMNPSAVGEAITERTKAIIVVHLYGHPADMNPLIEMARAHGIAIVEDAAEAHGAEYHGRRVGAIGDLATFSFFGNKIITTGEGGMVTTNRDDLAASLRMLKGQGVDPNRQYWFPIVGYNYRMTNIAAAIGCAQLEQIDWHVTARRNIAQWYQEALADTEFITLQPELPGAKNAYWMTSALLHGAIADRRDQVRSALMAHGIETRPFFPPIHILPPYTVSESRGDYPVAESLAKRGFNLPSSALLKQEDVQYIVSVLNHVLRDGR